MLPTKCKFINNYVQLLKNGNLVMCSNNMDDSWETHAANIVNVIINTSLLAVSISSVDFLLDFQGHFYRPAQQ